MYSLTINCDSAAQLGTVAKHLETLDLPPFLRTKTDTKAAPAKAETPAAPAVDESAPKPPKAPKAAKAAAPKEEETDGTTYEHVKEATFKLAGLPGNGSNLVKEVLARFSVDHATKLTPAQWKSYVDQATETYDKNKPAENLA